MKKRAWYKKWWIWVIAGISSWVIFLSLIGACSYAVVDNDNSTTFLTTESTASTETKTEAETEATIKETERKTETTTAETYTDKIAEETTVIETYYKEQDTEPETNENEYVETETEEEYAPIVEPVTDEENIPIVEEEPKDEGRDYVINTNTGKFHYPSCSSVNRIKSYNREDYYGTRDELINMGYEPCGNCHP